MRVCRLVRKPASSTSPRRRAQGSQLGHRHASDEDDNVGGTPSRRPQCRTAEQAIRRMSEEAPGDPGRHLVDALVSISPDRGRLPTDRRPTRRRKDSAVDVPLGCPLPAVLPAVSRSVRRFLTRSDPAEPLGFPNECGVSWGFRRIWNGFEARQPRHVKPFLGSLHGRQHLRRREHNHRIRGDRNRASPIVLVQPRRPRTARTTRVRLATVTARAVALPPARTARLLLHPAVRQDRGSKGPWRRRGVRANAAYCLLARRPLWRDCRPHRRRHAALVRDASSFWTANVPDLVVLDLESAARRPGACGTARVPAALGPLRADSPIAS